METIGKAAYKLDLPANAQIHLVVHVSQLKKHIPPNQVLEPIDIVAIDQSVALLPVQVLDVAMVRHGVTLKDRALVRWDKLLVSMSTWEDPQDMHRRYPTAWGQAASQQGGMSGTGSAPGRR